nr:hypothetical protein [Tanacetum cinerariifolium]
MGTSGNENNTSGNESSMSGNKCSEKSNFGNDTNIRPSYDTEPMAEVPNTADYNVFSVEKQHMSHNVSKVDQHAAEDESMLLASLIVNLKLDVDENKMIQKQLKIANMSLNHEHEKSKQDLEKSIKDLEISKQD